MRTSRFLVYALFQAQSSFRMFFLGFVIQKQNVQEHFMATTKTQNFRGISQVQVQDLGQVLHRTQNLVKESLDIVPIKFLN
jgi:hypothetical protein